MNDLQPANQAQKPSSAITALSVLVLVCAIIGLLGSFVPCLGIFAIYISVPTAIVGIITVLVAKNINAPRGLAVAGLVVALLASAIAIAQYSALDTTGKRLEQKNREVWGQ